MLVTLSRNREIGISFTWIDYRLFFLIKKNFVLARLIVVVTIYINKELLCCTPENSIMLHVNYSSRKKELLSWVLDQMVFTVTT